MFSVESTVVSTTCGYHPDTSDALELAGAHRFGQALVLGTKVPDLSDFVDQVRFRVAHEVDLPEGCYWFSHLNPPAMMIVTAGQPPRPPLRVALDKNDPGHSLVHAAGWFSHWWNDALEVPRPRFAVGAEAVTLPRGQDTVIRRRGFHSGDWFYEIRVDGRVQQLTERNLDDVPCDDDPAGWVHAAAASAPRFAATLTRAKLEGAFTDTLFSFRATRTLFRPYQFRPVMKLLETGQMRLLVADEVGLGKTIEAGLVWTELEARRLAGRVLVLCPSSLVTKWQGEMEERFAFDLVELDSQGLTDFARRLESDRLPPRFQYICSLERLRRWEELERVAELRPRFDLVIVDEAHSMRNVGTRSHALGSLLSEWTDALIFLSATPLNLRNTDLYNLLELLVPGEFEDAALLEQRLEPNAVLHKIAASLFDREVTNTQRSSWLQQIRGMTFGPAVTARAEFEMLEKIFAANGELNAELIVRAKRLMRGLHALSAAITRTRKVEINEDKAVRSARQIDVDWTPAEAAFYEAFYQWCLQRARIANTPVGFAMQMPLRVASTCLQVAKAQVLAWSPDATDPVDEDASRTDTNTKEPRPPALPPGPQLVQLALELGDVDTKRAAFEPMIKELLDQGRRVLVFTFSRPTLAYLHDTLRTNARVGILHGGVSKDARLKVMADFRAGEYDVLLANRVASEGLDFEFCSAVVNYDLPWNPMEIEQRIGRIDRIGQVEKKIYVINFHTPGTIEGKILIRVMQRIGVFEHSIGELEPILQSRLEELQRTIFDFTLSDDERERRADEILAAVQEKDLSRTEVEAASAYLMSSDGAEIEGLEASLLDRGRYVGQPELALLLRDWAETVGATPARTTKDGRALVLRGNAAMAQHVEGLALTGERSRREIETLSGALRAESEIHLSLDQEWSRSGGPSLLTANHPLVRAAMRVPGHRQARFASLHIAGSDAPQGHYLTLISVAKWHGLQPSQEVWTHAVDLTTMRSAGQAVGDAVLSRLANGELREGPTSEPELLRRAVDEAQDALLARMSVEERRRRAENEAFLQTRRISVREVNERKQQQIKSRIATLRARDKEGTIPLFEAQLRREGERLHTALRDVEFAENCGMGLEPIAVCEVVVGNV